MKKSGSFQELLESASESVKRTAHRKKIPIAISEDGCIKIIFPDKKIKIVSRTSRRKEKV